ncbi:hypothetical protein AU106_gp168 [Sinorhizobium phage phiM9]|uniref:Uncharacterized protein n=1 Tax=Sinorhizobium phage phiM9 TaxID=1636182 RepID=A0A0F6TGP4_9CAUD|nr:hypothetical protein AU106_gp168 [Sinorhizobium phage phiM9]AKE44799.1 hypothetical protein Sm_phiM9_171 [Sinorhizobium phage phiM9]
MIELRDLTDEDLKELEKTTRVTFLEARSKYRDVVYEQERRSSENCDQCSGGKLISKNGGGVACDSCNYWFCY